MLDARSCSVVSEPNHHCITTVRELVARVPHLATSRYLLRSLRSLLWLFISVKHRHGRLTLPRGSRSRILPDPTQLKRTVSSGFRLVICAVRCLRCIHSKSEARGRWRMVPVGKRPRSATRYLASTDGLYSWTRHSCVTNGGPLPHTANGMEQERHQRIHCRAPGYLGRKTPAI